ncbi:MAG: chromosome partitioning protein ParB, partial [Rhodobacteraceae bacterium]|nr:chromosome partitioning protein ParB [Paracoccaceae bacterium]
TEAYVAMVEENEIRANLSHYERGRLAAVAAGQGVFESVQAAVNELFASASKAKRSKIRSFAMIHESLGDLLAFPTDLSERAGLQLAASLRAMGAEPFRQALAQSVSGSAAEETQVLDAVMATEKAEKDPARGGRPATVAAGQKLEALGLASGGVVKADLFENGLTIRLTGQGLSPYEARQILERVRSMANRK